MASLRDFMDFDDSDIPADKGGSFEPIPAGDYVLQVDNEEVRLTKDQSGAMLVCTFKVLDGEHEGRLIFTNFNIRYKSAQAQKIGVGQLKALCLACNLDYELVKDASEMLRQIPFRAAVGFEKEQAGYERRNKITKYYPVDVAPPASYAPPVQQAAPQTPAAPPPRQAPPPTTQRPAGAGLPWQR
ncbi:MAG: DUF669 domain-containing protein [Beijerinckiaceae bacterium]|nr:DUF669 domain-containing protein [Beijerinckiaceae bacterium]